MTINMQFNVILLRSRDSKALLGTVTIDTTPSLKNTGNSSFSSSYFPFHSTHPLSILHTFMEFKAFLKVNPLGIVTSYAQFGSLGLQKFWIELPTPNACYCCNEVMVQSLPYFLGHKPEIPR